MIESNCWGNAKITYPPDFQVANSRIVCHAVDIDMLITWCNSFCIETTLNGLNGAFSWRIFAFWLSKFKFVTPRRCPATEA